jgi:hypothetical protein
LRQYQTHGQRLLFLENELLRVGVLVDKGADVFEFLFKPTDTEFMLHTLHGLTKPVVQSIASTAWGSFLDYYEGGWQEILPSGGPPCTYKGVEFGLHGEISTIPWEYRIELDTVEEIRATLEVRPFRIPLHLEKSLTLRRGEPILIIEETLENEGREPVELMWGHHPAFGAPFLSPSCRVDLPEGDLLLEVFEEGSGTRISRAGRYPWPTVPDSQGVPIDFSRPDAAGTGHEDLGYLVNLPEGWYAITNQELEVGFALSWSLEAFPYLWIWRQFNQSAGYPWYGRVYTVALEPWSSYPSAGLVKAIDNGTARVLEPGQSVQASLRAIAYQGAQRVAGVSSSGEISARQ